MKAREKNLSKFIFLFVQDHAVDIEKTRENGRLVSATFTYGDATIDLFDYLDPEDIKMILQDR